MSLILHRILTAQMIQKCINQVYYNQPLNLKMDQKQPQSKKKIKRQRRKRNRYNKIPLKMKLLFYRKVIHERANIRDIAKRLGLKYSTAKTLIRNYKEIPQEKNQELMSNICQTFDRKQKTKRRCTYREITSLNQISQSSRLGQNKNLQFTSIPKIQIICNYMQSSSQ